HCRATRRNLRSAHATIAPTWVWVGVHTTAISGVWAVIGRRASSARRREPVIRCSLIMVGPGGDRAGYRPTPPGLVSEPYVEAGQFLAVRSKNPPGPSRSA